MLYTFIILQNETWLLNHIVSRMYKLRKNGHGTRQKEGKGTFFCILAIKSNSLVCHSSTDHGVKYWILGGRGGAKIKKEHLELSRVHVWGGETVLRLNVNKKNGVKGSKRRVWGDTHTHTHTGCDQKTSSRWETRNALQVDASTITLSSAFRDTVRRGGKAFIKVQIWAPPPCTPGRPPGEEKKKVYVSFPVLASSAADNIWTSQLSG